MVNLVKSRGYSYYSTLKWVVRNSKDYMKKSTKYLRIYKIKSRYVKNVCIVLEKSNPVISSVQSLSGVWLFAAPWTAACQASLSFTISWSLLKLMSIELVMPSNFLIFCHPLHLLPSILPSIKVFSESALCISWPKYWRLTFSISPFNEYLLLLSRFSCVWLCVAP